MSCLYVLLTSIPIARSVGILLSLEQGTGAGTAGETAEAKAAALANKRSGQHAHSALYPDGSLAPLCSRKD